MTSDPSTGREHPELPLDPDAPDEARGARPLHLRATAVATVFAGGALGTAARYGLATWRPTRPDAWPTGTLLANLAGAFVLGLLLEYLARAGDDTGWRRRSRLLVGTGFCGGLTTYSTFAVEADLLIGDGSAGLAVLYLAVTVLAGLVAVTLGVALAAGHRRARDRTNS